MGLQIRKEDPGRPDIVALLEAGEARSAALYPAESNHHVGLDVLRSVETAFFVGRTEDGRAVATGAVVDKGGWGEIKRMFVDDAVRGRGYGRLMLGILRAEAVRGGLTVLRLETGVRSFEALGLYRSAGFVEIGPFADYRSDPNCVFMELVLPRR